MTITSPLSLTSVFIDNGLTLECTTTDIYKDVSVSWTTDVAGVTLSSGIDYTLGSLDLQNNQKVSVLEFTSMSNFPEGLATFTCEIIHISGTPSVYSNTYTVDVYNIGQSYFHTLKIKLISADLLIYSREISRS